MAGGIIKGTGVSTDPYLIEDVQDFVKIAHPTGDLGNGTTWATWATNPFRTKFSKLMADIDMVGVTGWSGAPPADSSAFDGTFDGNGFKIKNWTFLGGNDMGMFGYLRGKVKNLHIVNPNIRGGSVNGFGAFCSMLYGGIIEACSVQGGTIDGQGNESVGSFAGNAWMGGIASGVYDCYSTANVLGGNGVGGIIGTSYTAGGGIVRCYYSGELSAIGLAGGIFGRSKSGVYKVTSCFALSPVIKRKVGSADTSFGDIVGNTGNITLSNNYSLDTMEFRQI